MNIFEKIIEVIFPKKCVGCERRGFLICATCVQKIPPSINSEHEFITSVFSYTSPLIRQMIHMMKYRGGRHVATFFAPYVLASLYEFIGEEKLFLGSAPILLVPVPLSRKRMKLRGYNQSELLIKEIIKLDTKKNFLIERNLVAKIKDTPPQAQIKKRSLRIVSQKNCFAVLPNSKTKREIIILIDDVTTTGATLVAVRNALKKSGFKKVYAFTIAH
ncbi:MAG: hypothetical protein WCO65_01970 [bacterium]